MQVNKNFKELREELKLTQQDMAVYLDVSRITYIKWETEPNTIPLGKYEQLMTELERLKAIKEGN